MPRTLCYSIPPKITARAGEKGLSLFGEGCRSVDANTQMLLSPGFLGIFSHSFIKIC